VLPRRADRSPLLPRAQGAPEAVSLSRRSTRTGACVCASQPPRSIVTTHPRHGDVRPW
jgi:hypothetical protein